MARRLLARALLGGALAERDFIAVAQCGRVGRIATVDLGVVAGGDAVDRRERRADLSDCLAFESFDLTRVRARGYGDWYEGPSSVLTA